MRTNHRDGLNHNLDSMVYAIPMQKPAYSVIFWDNSAYSINFIYGWSNSFSICLFEQKGFYDDFNKISYPQAPQSAPVGFEIKTQQMHTY